VNTRKPTVALVVLLAGLPFVALAVGTAGAREARVVNDSLEQVMDAWPADADIEVLVRFKDGPITSDLEHLRWAGLDPLQSLHALPVTLAKGPTEAVWRASLDPRVAWVEWNRPIQYYMENSTNTVNASRVWETLIEDTALQYPSIDGTGVTVVVVDTGADGGHPDLQHKIILNLEMERDGGFWKEWENTDIAMGGGHGTHVTGTVGGDGTASAGGRRGVAPGANLIVLAAGDIGAGIFSTLSALQWVYDHSHPGENPYNIRVATNSWGASDGPYDPNDATVILSEKITYENNVVVTFAAGNGGTDDHDGSTVTTSVYANTPAVISVAAYLRDGSGMATFSSRGAAADNATWPDVGAPGVEIYSTRAMSSWTRRECAMSFIDIYPGNSNDCDPYYMAISGTSMATPHVAGEVALLWQAAPSMHVSNYHADFGSDPNTSAENLANWYSNPRTRLHEAEVILKLTAQFLSTGPTTDGQDNGVPPYEEWTGLAGRSRDFAQGYGLNDMNAAVSLALTLEKMRKQSPEATVLDAYAQWRGLTAQGRPVSHIKEFEAKTDTLVTGWSGLYSRFNDQNGKPILIQNETKYVFVPNGTTQLSLDLTYETLNLNDGDAGTVTWHVERPDGSSSTGPLIGGNGHKSATFNDLSSQAGATWKFSVVGAGLRIQPVYAPADIRELRLHFAFGLTSKIETSPGTPIVVEFADYHAQYAQWRFLDNGSAPSNGSIVLTRPVFDLTQVHGLVPAPRDRGSEAVLWWIEAVAALVVAAAGLLVFNERRAHAGKAPLPVVGWWRISSLRPWAQVVAQPMRGVVVHLRVAPLATQLRGWLAGVQGKLGRLALRRRAG
jgi:serine protease AprX